MFLDQGSVWRLDEWWDSAESREGERERVLEFLETLRDGSWHTRWYVSRDLAGSPYASERWNIWLSDELLAITDMHSDGVQDQVGLILLHAERPS